MGRVYVTLDAEMQETKLAEPIGPIEVTRFMPPTATAPAPELVAQAAKLLKSAKNPLILMGRVSRSLEGWNQRVALAEALNAKVITELKLGAAFPTDHPLHAGPPGSTALGPQAQEAMREADVILSLDWVDLAGACKGVFTDGVPAAKVIVVSNDFRIHRGWSMDYQGLPVCDVMLATTPEEAVPDLLKAVGGAVGARKPAPAKPAARPELSTDKLVVNDLVRALKIAVGERDVTLAHISLSWDGATWPFRHPLDYVGSEGGGGVGGGPGNAVGTALALMGTGLLAAAGCGDADCMMANAALWPAVHS